MNSNSMIDFRGSRKKSEVTYLYLKKKNPPAPFGKVLELKRIRTSGAQRPIKSQINRNSSSSREAGVQVPGFFVPSILITHL